MWCPDCNKQFSYENDTCPKCGARLEENQTPELAWGRYIPGEVLSKWLYNEDGSPVKPALLKHCSCVGMDDRMLESLLDAYEIPFVKQYPQGGSFGAVILGISGNGVDIYVPETILNQALDIISGEVENADN